MCRQNTIAIAITDPSPCDRGMNAEQAWICRYSRSVYTRFGKVGPSSRNGAGRAESNNRTRFVCKPPPNGQQEHTNHCPPPSMENSRVQSRVPPPGPLGLLNGTQQSARTTVATFTAYRYPRFYLGLSVRRYRQVQTRPRRAEYDERVIYGYIYVQTLDKLVYTGIQGASVLVRVHMYSRGIQLASAYPRATSGNSF